MAETVIRGPSVSLGSLLGGGGTSDPYDGPGISYQGDAIPDVRYNPANKDGLQTARIPSFLSTPYVVMTDSVPYASLSTTSNASIAGAQYPTNGTALTLVTTQASTQLVGASTGIANTTTLQFSSVTAGATGVTCTASGGTPFAGTVADVSKVILFQDGSTWKQAIITAFSSTTVCTVTNGGIAWSATTALTAGSNWFLGSSQTSAAHGYVPLIPQTYPTAYTGAAGAAIQVLALDFGFSFVNTTSGSTTLSCLDSSLFYVGQWICVAGAAGTAKGLMTQVTAIPTATTLTVSVAPSATIARAPVGSTNYTGPFPAQAAGTAVTPYWNGGVAALFNPVEGTARNIAIYAVANAATNTFTVNGFDVYGNKMTEVISLTTSGSAQTVYGKKAFKYIYSIVPSVTDGSHYIYVGTGDVIGYNIRSDKWEYTENFYNGTFTSASTGWMQALQPSAGAANSTSQDVRGTIQVGPAGAGTAISGGTTLTGAIRVALFMNVPLNNLIQATPSAPQYMFGTAQYSGF